MITILLVCIILLLLIPGHVAHGLNIVFRLPHPGPNDIQGTCSCRRHEGPDKYSFRDYIRSTLR